MTTSKITCDECKKKISEEYLAIRFIEDGKVWQIDLHPSCANKSKIRESLGKKLLDGSRVNVFYINPKSE